MKQCKFLLILKVSIYRLTGKMFKDRKIINENTINVASKLENQIQQIYKSIKQFLRKGKTDALDSRRVVIQKITDLKFSLLYTNNTRFDGIVHRFFFEVNCLGCLNVKKCMLIFLKNLIKILRFWFSKVRIVHSDGLNVHVFRYHFHLFRLR